MSDLSIYLLAYVGLLIYGVIVLRVIVRKAYARYGRLSVTGTFLQAILFFVYGGFPYLYLEDDWPAFHVNWIIHVLGMGCIVVGLRFLLLGMFRLGVLRSLGRGKGDYVQTGLYCKTRNPQALSCGLYVIGFIILWPSWYAVGWAVLYGVLIHLMILAEEEHLLRTHGEGYQRYCQEVPRYLLFRQGSGFDAISATTALWLLRRFGYYDALAIRGASFIFLGIRWPPDLNPRN